LARGNLVSRYLATCLDGARGGASIPIARIVPIGRPEHGVAAPDWLGAVSQTVPVGFRKTILEQEAARIEGGIYGSPRNSFTPNGILRLPGIPPGVCDVIFGIVPSRHGNPIELEVDYAQLRLVGQWLGRSDQAAPSLIRVLLSGVDEVAQRARLPFFSRHKDLWEYP
jgi:hypothetical protein